MIRHRSKIIKLDRELAQLLGEPLKGRLQELLQGLSMRELGEKLDLTFAQTRGLLQRHGLHSRNQTHVAPDGRSLKQFLQEEGITTVTYKTAAVRMNAGMPFEEAVYTPATPRGMRSQKRYTSATKQEAPCQTPETTTPSSPGCSMRTNS